MKPIKTKVKIESLNEPGMIHPIGSYGIAVEKLTNDVWIIEIRIPDERLVGDAWYETLEASEKEFDFI